MKTVEDAIVDSNWQLAGDLWQLVLRSKSIPKQIEPGQFVHLRLGEKSEHILRRPLSVHDVFADQNGNFEYLSLVYQVVGEGTDYLTTFSKGDTLNLIGPLGRGWQPARGINSALLVGGGVGWVPLALLAGSLTAMGVEVHCLIGARNAEYYDALAGGADFRPYALRDTQGADTEKFFEHVATDDGSAGHHGFNTDLLEGLLAKYNFDYVATCGPEPMQSKVAAAAMAREIDCDVSLERRMACGVGACLSCAVDTVDGSKRACVDGPVFKAQEVVW
ncbi:MAG: dihydroorotate dehydrogenase electron transfer subunit [Coriobacteriales bacterium]|nr:dihydroorotate dehydrogenase electron transfer subunit [Coriobacteriales bacterium]